MLQALILCFFPSYAFLILFMQQPSQSIALFSSFYTLGLVVAGLWYLMKRKSIFAQPAGVAPSQGSALDSLFFFWGLLVAFCSSVYLPGLLAAVSKKFCPKLAWNDPSPALTSTVLALCVSVFLGLSFRYQKAFWSPRLDSSLAKLRSVLPQSVLLFLGLCPLLLLLSLFWQGLLSFLVGQGYIEEPQRQTIIEAFLESSGLIPTLVLGFNAIILAPILEELIFRAGLYRFLKARLPSKWASLLSSFCFACLHGNLQAFAPLWLLGWWLNASYEKTGSIWSPICVHSLFNSNSLWMLYLSAVAGAPL